MPLCLGTSGSVRAMRIPTWLMWAPEDQIFDPFTTYSSPSRSARVPRAARSDPASGSLNSWQQNHLPERIGGRNRSFCSSVPALRIVGAAQPMPIGLVGRDTPAARSSSSMSSWCIGSASSPHGSGQWGTT